MRASSLPPQQRRAAIIAATERLIIAHGSGVNTRAIAEAAGIAEGTIFRVFPTKAAIIDAIFDDALSDDASKAELEAIDPHGDLKIRMIEVVSITQRRLMRIFALFAALGIPRQLSVHNESNLARDEARLLQIAAIIAPDGDELRLPPVEVARLLIGTAVAASLPSLAGRLESEPKEIVDVLLNGIALRPAVSDSKDSVLC